MHLNKKNFFFSSKESKITMNIWYDVVLYKFIKMKICKYTNHDLSINNTMPLIIFSSFSFVNFLISTGRDRLLDSVGNWVGFDRIFFEELLRKKCKKSLKRKDWENEREMREKRSWDAPQGSLIPKKIWILIPLSLCALLYGFIRLNSLKLRPAKSGRPI